MGDLNPGVVNVGVYVGMCMCNGRPDPVTRETSDPDYYKVAF